MLQNFRIVYVLESISLRQDRAADLLKNTCADVATDRTWADEGLRTSNLHLADLEVQGLEKFTDWRENLGQHWSRYGGQRLW